MLRVGLVSFLAEFFEVIYDDVLLCEMGNGETVLFQKESDVLGLQFFCKPIIMFCSIVIR